MKLAWYLWAFIVALVLAPASYKYVVVKVQQFLDEVFGIR